MTGLNVMSRRNGLLPTILLLISAAMLAGCGHVQTVTVKTWEEPGEQFTPDKWFWRQRGHKPQEIILDRSAPRLSKGRWNDFPFGMAVTLDCNAKQEYTAAQPFTNCTVTRTSGEKPKPELKMALACWPLWPISVWFLPELVGEKPENTTPQQDDKAIAEMLALRKRTGHTSVTLKRGKSQYKLAMEGGTTTLIPNQVRQVTIPAEGVAVRVCNVQGTTNAEGQCELTLADSRPAMMRLTANTYPIEARWDGRWRPIGKVTLTELRLSKAMTLANRELMKEEGTPKLPPRGVVKVDAPAGVDADDSCEVAMTVTNTGKGEFYRLVGTLKSADHSFDGTRFEFGKMIPGETLTLTRRIPIPRKHASGAATFRVAWDELNGYVPDEAVARTYVRGKDSPAFATAVQVIDDMTGNSVGNGDGRIQKGEAVDLLVTVKNVGDGEARNVSVCLTDLSRTPGIVVPAGEATLGDLASGQSKQARLTVTTKKAARIKRLTPELTVREEYLDIRQTKNLNFPLGEQLGRSVLAYKATMYVGETPAVVRSGAGEDAGMLAQVDPGVAMRVTGELDEWVRIEDEQFGTGWVRKTHLTDTAPAVQTAAAVQTGGVVRVLASRKPLLAIMSPKADATVTRAKTVIEGMAADDQGLTSLTVTLNGQIVQPVEGQKAIGVVGLEPASTEAGDHGREQKFAVPVVLEAGVNEITVVAVNTLGLSETKTCRVMFEEPTGQVHLVSIGVSAYDSVRPRLKYAAEDARAVAACLRQGLAIPDSNVTLLVDDQATKRNIETVLGTTLRNTAAPDDTVIIYFSGHGAPEADPRSPDRDGVEKYLLPVDAEKESLYSTAIAMDDVRDIFQRIDSERVIFLADSCYSGQAGGRSITPDRQYRNIDQGSLLKRLQQTGKGRVIITASAADEVSQEDASYGHGVFTYHLLRGLEGAADADRDGEVTVFELFTHVNREVPRVTRNRQHPKAKMEDTDGNIVLSFTATAK